MIYLNIRICFKKSKAAVEAGKRVYDKKK